MKPNNSPPPQSTLIDISELKFAKDAPKDTHLVVRKDWPRSGASWDELVASIKSHGVFFPLVFKEVKGQKYVISGNRRLDVLTTEIWPTMNGKPLMVPCIDVDDYKNGDPRELAWAANIQLPPHPVDRFELFAMLMKDGMKDGDLAERFVLTARQVAQVKAIDRLSPVIRNAWRSGEIDADTAKAFTLGHNHAEQDKVFNSLAKSERLHEHGVRERFIGQQQDSGRLLIFVGMDAYTAKGGKITQDFFENHHTVSNTKLLHKMAQDKLHEELERLTKQEGWSWALLDDEMQDKFAYSRLPQKPVNATEQKTIDGLKAKIEAETDSEKIASFVASIRAIETTAEMRSYTSKNREEAGCSVGIGDDGELVITYGWIKHRSTAIEAKGKAKSKAKGKDASGLSNALMLHTSQQLTKAVAAVLRSEPKLACAALIAGFASHGDVLAVTEMGPDTKRIPLEKRKPADFASLFDRFKNKDQATLANALANVAAQALDLESTNSDHPPLKDKGIAALIAMLPGAKLQKQLALHFDCLHYFNSVSRAAVVAAVKEIDPKAKGLAGGKDSLAKGAARMADKAGWLPAMLRTNSYDGPGAKKAR